MNITEQDRKLTHGNPDIQIQINASFSGWGEIYEPVREISNNVICATSKASGQPAHTRSLIRAFASRLSI